MKKAHLILIGLLIVGGGVYVKARGLRNNNPGNIKKSNIKWEGARAVQTDKTFVQFVSVEYGIRAMAKVLTNYQSIHGLDSVRTIIGRWAPPGDDNPTERYAEVVARKMGVGVDDKFSLDYRVGYTRQNFLVPLIKAIIAFENGINPYSDKTINAGIDLI